MHGEARTRDGSGAGSTICLKDVAVDLDGELTKAKIVEHRADAATNEALNLLRATTNLLTLT